MRQRSAVALLFLIALGAVAADAAPSRLDVMGLSYDAWAATHIVVATEGPSIDGHVRVLESWVGDLKPGAEISVRELAGFAAEDRRRIATGLHARAPGAPRFVSGSRIILFLRRFRGRWVPARVEINGRRSYVSAAWIEDGKVYALWRGSIPGAYYMIPADLTEEALRTGVLHVTGSREALHRALAIADPGRRAAALLPLARSDVAIAAHKAQDGLSNCGSAAPAGPR